MSESLIKHEYDPSRLEQRIPGVIEVCDLVKTYRSKAVVNSVSFSVAPGSVFALLGENGAGKTTTIRMLLGESRPTSGHVQVLHVNPADYPQVVRPKIGYVPEVPILYNFMTVEQLGKLAAPFNTEGYFERYARRIEEFGIGLRVKISNLSKGMKAMTSLALELARDPEILILDEPTSGLDPLVRRRFLANIADLAAAGKTVFLSSHQITEVERVADHVAFLKNGKFVFMDSLAAIADEYRTLEVTVRGDFEVAPDLYPSLFAGEFIQSERLGAARRLVGRKLVPDYEARLRAAYNDRFVEANVSVPSLEDLFVAYMTR